LSGSPEAAPGSTQTTRAGGAMIALSTWDTREHARFRRDALESAAAADSRRMEDAAAQMDPPEVYEIAAQVS